MIDVLPISAAAIVVVAAAAGCQLIWDIHGWAQLIAVGAVLSVTYLPVAYWLILNREDRALAWSYIPKIYFR